MTIDISSFSCIVTKQDSRKFIEQLERFERVLFNVNVDLPKEMEKIFSQEEVDFLEAALEKEGIKLGEKTLAPFIKAVKEAILAAPTVGLELAFEPTEKVLREIADTLSSQYQKKVFIDVTINSAIIGGVVITENGKYKDFSLRKKIEDLAIEKEKQYA